MRTAVEQRWKANITTQLAQVLYISFTAALGIKQSAVCRVYPLYHTCIRLPDVCLNFHHFCYLGTFVLI